MDDLISRQAAISHVDDVPYIKEHPNVGLLWKAWIESLPSAQPERKRGEWVYAEDEYGIDGYHCNQCGFFVPWDYTHKFINYIEDYHFCPNCGADMR